VEPRKYQGVGQSVAQNIAQAAGAEAGLAAGAISAAITRERHVQNLVTKVPGQNLVLLKTVGELRLIDLETGQTQWQVEDVTGTSLVHSEWLSSGDLIVVTGTSSLVGSLTGEEGVLRIDPETGDVRWRAEHSADAVTKGIIDEGRLLLQHGDRDVEGFDLSDGTKVLAAETSWKADVASYAGQVEYKGQQYQVSVTGGATIGQEGIYVPHLAETQVVGAPSYGVEKHSWSTGKKAWSSDSVEGMNALQDLVVTENWLLGRAIHFGGGALGSDPRQRLVGWNLEDGTLEWNQKTPYDASDAALIRVGPMGGEPPPSWNLVTSEGQAYVATDTSITGHDVSDGTVTASASADVSCAPVWITEAGGYLVDLRAEGVSFHAPSGLSPTSEPIPFASELVTFDQTGDYLLARTEDALHVVNMIQQTLAGTVAQEDAGALVTGRLRSGFFITEDESSLFVLTPDRVVQKYRIP